MNVNLFRLCIDYVVCCSKRPSLIGGMKPLVALPLYCVMRPKQSTGTSKSEEMWIEQFRFREIDVRWTRCSINVIGEVYGLSYLCYRRI